MIIADIKAWCYREMAARAMRVRESLCPISEMQRALRKSAGQWKRMAEILVEGGDE